MSKKIKQVFPVMPLRDIVVFPHMIVPIFVGRPGSVAALDAAIHEKNKEILLVLQKNNQTDEPLKKDLYDVGVVGTLLQVLKLPDGTIKLLVQGGERKKITQFVKQKEGYLAANTVPFPEDLILDDELSLLVKNCLEQFDHLIKSNRKTPPEVLDSIMNLTDPSKIADTMASYFTLKLSEKQELLEIQRVNKRLEKILGYIQMEVSLLDVEKKIRARVKQQMEKTQRDYYLTEQLKAINKELNDNTESREDIVELEKKRHEIKLSDEASTKVESEIKKLRMMHPASAEAGVIRNYVDWVLSVPWNQRSKILKDLKKSEEILNKDHYGLDKVKERILEYLTVQKRMEKVKSQILCLVGPPGVGKTSLGQSIAKATGRNFVRMSLGGVRDESEIRGHRRTYMGSMPGRIIQGMKKAKTSNPLFLLDEIDKIGHDWRGDPAAALLEVLDPEQNAAFNDHYLEIDYDLSDVMFVTTANSLDMPQPLLDRMEIIRIPGYTEYEKLEIAKRHLLSKQLQANGLKESEITIEDDLLLHIIRHYTKEAGVRNLEREISKIARKVVRLIDKGTSAPLHVTKDNIEHFLSVPKFQHGQINEVDQVGITTGLAWTELGGDILSIEVITVPGKGQIKITGKLGDVMQESAHAALSYVRSKAYEFGLKASIFEKKDVHIHVPAGATPKDGPSAGIALCTSLVSSYTNIPVRRDVAMTGEITLRGLILPIGGLKEKILAAHRSGIKTVLLPFENAKDLVEISDDIKNSLNLITVKTIDDVLDQALNQRPNKISPEDSDDLEFLRLNGQSKSPVQSPFPSQPLSNMM